MAVEFQVTFDAYHPPTLAEFWALALQYIVQPPPPGFDSWEAFLDEMEIPEERPLLFQEVLTDQLSPSSFQLGVAMIPSAAAPKEEKAQTGDEIFLRGELTGSEERQPEIEETR